MRKVAVWTSAVLLVGAVALGAGSGSGTGQGATSPPAESEKAVKLVVHEIQWFETRGTDAQEPARWGKHIEVGMARGKSDPERFGFVLSDQVGPKHHLAEDGTWIRRSYQQVKRQDPWETESLPLAGTASVTPGPEPDTKTISVEAKDVPRSSEVVGQGDPLSSAMVDYAGEMTGLLPGKWVLVESKVEPALLVVGKPTKVTMTLRASAPQPVQGATWLLTLPKSTPGATFELGPLPEGGGSTEECGGAMVRASGAWPRLPGTARVELTVTPLRAGTIDLGWPIVVGVLVREKLFPACEVTTTDAETVRHDVAMRVSVRKELALEVKSEEGEPR